MSIRGGVARPTILLVEDNDADAFFFRRCMGALGLDAQLHLTGTASLARRYLEGVAPFANRDYFRLPELIVADMHLGDATALELARWMHPQPAFENIPFVIYTGELWPAEEELCKGLVMAVYRKSDNFTEARQIVAQVLQHLPAP